MTHTYRFAGRTVDIRALYPDVYALCVDYRAEGATDFTVSTTQADIEFEREKNARESMIEGSPVREHTDGYLETLAVYRQISERMPHYNTILFHGSCIAADGMSYLFTAKSGTGKSTHTRLWRELLGDQTVMVNDDKPLIRVTGDGVVAYGTPWNGKHRLSSNIAVPLKAICILERSAENHIREVTPSEALPMLLQQVYRPMDAAAMIETLNLIDRLAGFVKLYRLGCNMNIEAAKVAYGAMRGATP